jgi:hypothetical protein
MSRRIPHFDTYTTVLTKGESDARSCCCSYVGIRIGCMKEDPEAIVGAVTDNARNLVVMEMITRGTRTYDGVERRGAVSGMRMRFNITLWTGEPSGLTG